MTLPTIARLGLAAVCALAVPAAAAAQSVENVASRRGCGDQVWPGTLHFQVVDGALGARVLDCRTDPGARRIDVLLDDAAYVTRLFETLVAIAPEYLVAQIDEFVLTASHPHSGGGISAYISPATDDIGQFNFGLSIGGHVRPRDWTDIEILHTIVHEFAHILSLDADEITPLDNGSICQTHQPWIAHCARPGSVIEAYRQRFWPGGQALSRRDAAFVSSYAQTNVEEDFAETFASWVLEPHTLADGTVLGEKAEFFEKIEEFLAVRDHIRARLGLAPIDVD